MYTLIFFVSIPCEFSVTNGARLEKEIRLVRISLEEIGGVFDL